MDQNRTKTYHLECLGDLGLKLLKMVPKLTVGVSGRPGPEMVQNGVKTDHLERLGSLGSK